LFYLFKQTGSFATVALNLFRSSLSPLVLPLNKNKDICGFLEEKLRMHWQETKNGVLSFKGQFDEAFLKVICRVVAGALDAHPIYRWTPAKILEELDQTG